MSTLLFCLPALALAYWLIPPDQRIAARRERRAFARSVRVDISTISRGRGVSR